jgi:alpha-1,3-mannosyltransferase
VYPAGFVYIFSALYYATGYGTSIVTAQCIYLVLYLALLALVLHIYHETRVVPPWAMLLLCASHRIHSIFVLRLFNDCVAMLLLYAAILLMIRNRWSWASLCFTLAVSVKMNVLLFAPALLLLLWRRFGFIRALGELFICAFVQVALAVPFLAVAPQNYMRGAFNFGRQFFYKWTVNLRFLSEARFLSSQLAVALLVAHVVTLCYTLSRCEPGGLLGAWRRALASPAAPRAQPSARHLVTPMVAANFVGMVFARSLHYQFYVWYFHSLVYLLWVAGDSLAFFRSGSTRSGMLLRRGVLHVAQLALLFAIEYVWNVFPARADSSLLLLACHTVLLVGIVAAMKPEPTEQKKSTTMTTTTTKTRQD